MGVPYLVTAAISWFRIGRCNSQKSALELIYTAPLIFAPLQLLALLLWSFAELGSSGLGLATDLMLQLKFSLMMTVFGLVFGYGYAIFAAVIFPIAIRAGHVSSFTNVELDSAKANAV